MLNERLIPWNQLKPEPHGASQKDLATDREKVDRSSETKKQKLEWMHPGEAHGPPVRAMTRPPGEEMKWPPDNEQQVHCLG